MEVFCSQRKKIPKKKKENNDQVDYKLEKLVIRGYSSDYKDKDKDRKSNKDIIENNDFKKKMNHLL